jgi:tetratricopeptide (TPR) repeat protein
VSAAQRHLLALGTLAALVTSAYANSFGAGFVFDSRALVLENPVVQHATLANVRFLLTSDYWQPLASDGLYRPLTTLSYLFNYAVLGNAGGPFGYHALNLLLHLGCASLVYALVWRLERRQWPALVAAMLFGVHPLATEAVTNIVGRADLLAAAGVLGGLLCHVNARAGGGWWWSAGLLVAAAVAFFSKESGLVLVGAIAVYDLVFRAADRRWLRSHLLVGGVLLAYLAARWYVERNGPPVEDLSPIDNPLVEAGLLAGRLTAVKAAARQLWLLVWPATLSADYSYRQIPVVAWPPGSWEDWQALIALAALVALAGIIARTRRHPGLFFLALFSVVAFVPTANLLVLIGSIMAERFLYLPLVGLAGAVAVIGESVARRGRGSSAAVHVALAIVLLACAGRTWARNRDWADEQHLWASAVRVSPASAKAHKAFAAALLADGPPEAALDRAIGEAEQAVAIRSDYLDALVDLGGYYIRKGDQLADGAAWYAKSVALLEQARPLDARGAHRFVEKMVARGHAQATLPDHGNPALYQNLALAYARSARFEDALAAYEQVRRLQPADVTHYIDVSAVLCNLGRWEDAAVALLQAITIDPGSRDVAARLVEVYRRFFPEGHALIEDAAGRVQINLDDPAVRRHRCRAYQGLAGIYARAKLPGPATRMRELAARFCRE